MNELPFVASWSGGKDSAMAYYRAVKSGLTPKMLLTMFEENEKISKSHALSLEIIQAQAKSLKVPLLIKGANWNNYETQFLEALEKCKKFGIKQGVFGDVDLEDHLKWVQETCAKVGMKALHPLWMESRRGILEEFIEAGFEAYIVVVNTKMMPAHFIGRKFTRELMDELEELSIDSCGESGEFHTLVVDGPLFTERVPVLFSGEYERDGYVFLPAKLNKE